MALPATCALPEHAEPLAARRPLQVPNPKAGRLAGPKPGVEGQGKESAPRERQPTDVAAVRRASSPSDCARGGGRSTRGCGIAAKAKGPGAKPCPSAQRR